LAQKYDEKVVTFLLWKYPIREIGMFLIFGPLPAQCTSYDTERFFELDGSCAAAEGYGYGLVFQVDEENNASIQFGNGVRKMQARDIARNYRPFLTGRPFPSSLLKLW
jgi:hypothetical protein